MDTVFVTNSVGETQAIAFDIASKVKDGGVVGLFGDLGAGKTTFAQGIAKKLGIKRRVISPSFLIVRAYELDDNRKFYHIDLYRLGSKGDLRSIGLREIVSEPRNIVLIEWAEKAQHVLPEKRIEVHMEHIGEFQRKLRIIRK